MFFSFRRPKKYHVGGGRVEILSILRFPYLLHGVGPCKVMLDLPRVGPKEERGFRFV